MLKSSGNIGCSFSCPAAPAQRSASVPFIRRLSGTFWQPMMWARQTIVVMITFRNYNDKSLQAGAGVYRSSTKKHPILRILQVLIFSRRLLLNLLFYIVSWRHKVWKNVYRHRSKRLPPIRRQIYTTLPALEFWRRIMRTDRLTQLSYMLSLYGVIAHTHTHTQWMKFP
jgi:hypothetical protein